MVFVPIKEHGVIHAFGLVGNHGVLPSIIL